MQAAWIRDPTVRLRPVPELASCLVYARHPPTLYGLNLTSWLVLTLCDGRDRETLGQAFAEAMGPAGGAGASPQALEEALVQLEALKLIRRVPEGEQSD